MNNPKQSQYSTKTRCWASCKHWPRKGQTEIVLIYLSAVSHKCVFPNLNSVITPPGECWDFLHTRRVRVWGWDWFSAQASTPSSSNGLKVTFWMSQVGTSVTFTQKQKFKHILISFAGTFRVQLWDCEMRSFLSISYLCLERGPWSHLSNSTAGRGWDITHMFTKTKALARASSVKLSSRHTEES